MSENIFDNVFDQKYDCSDDSCEEIPVLGSFPIFVNPSTCAAPQEVNINYGTIGATGNLVAGNNIALSGNLSDRILGSGDVTISAVLPPIQSPLTFENGLREDNGVVKLGLDVSTLGTTNLGILTEDTYLAKGNLASGINSALISISGGAEGESVSIQSVGDTEHNTILQLTNERLRLSRTESSASQSIEFSPTGVMAVQDDVSNFGLSYQGNYFSAGSLSDRWIPDWGAVTNYVDTEIGSIPSPTLQSVTNEGNSTNNAINVTGGNGSLIDGGISLVGLGAQSWVARLSGGAPTSSLRLFDNNLALVINDNGVDKSIGLQPETSVNSLVTIGGRASGSDPLNTQDFVTLGYLTDEALSNYIPLSQKAQANGVATLDGGGKVPLTQLPAAIMIYRGTWDASNNTPTLADGTGTAGDVYRVSVAGNQDLGSGVIDFEVGDYVIYNGTSWEKSDTTDAVASIFGRVGNVTAQEGDYASFYPRLSQSYDNPSWINSLDYSKLTNVPPTPTLQSVTDASYTTTNPLSVNGTGSIFSRNLQIGNSNVYTAITPATGTGLILSRKTTGFNLDFYRNNSIVSQIQLGNGADDSSQVTRIRQSASTGGVGAELFLSGTGEAFFREFSSTDPIRVSGADPLSPLDFVNLQTLNSALGSYLPLAGTNGVGAMTGLINMGNNDITNASSFVSGTFSGNYGYLYPSGLTIARTGSGSYSHQVSATNNFSSFSTPISPGNSTGFEKFRLFAADNRTTDGNPNIQIAQFLGSVQGRMDGTSDPDGYEGQFATQDYVDAAISGLDFTSLPGFGLSWNSTTNKIDWGTELSSGIHGVLVPDGEALYMGKIGGFMSNLGAITTASSTNGGIGYTAPVTGVVQHGFSFYNAPSGGYTGTTPPVVFTDNLNIGGLHYADDYSSNYTDRSIPDVGWVNAQIASLPTPTAQTLSLGASSGEIAISGGNTIALKSLSRETSFTTDIITAFDPLPYGLHPFSNSSGSTGFPANGSGIYNKRLSETQLGSFAIWTGVSGNNSLYYNIGSGTSSFNGWQTFASQEWTDTKDFLVSQAITDLTDANRFDRQSSFLSSSSSSYVPFTGNGVGLHLKYSTVNRGAQIWIPLNEAYAPQYRGMTSTSSWDSVKEFVVGGVNQTAIGGNKEWSGEHTFSQNILFNKTLSAGNKLIDLQQGYSIWSDNVGSLGSTTRLWFDAPNEGGMVFGPRGSLSKLTSLRVRANVSNFEGSIELPTAWSPTAANHVATKGYVDSQSALEPLDEGNGIGYRVRGGVAANYGNIGQRAVDFSYSSSASTINGATGLRAVAFGFNTRASGNSSVAFGQNSAATNTSSVAFGSGQATGVRAVSFGGTAAGENSLTFGDTDNSANARNTFVGGSDNIANSPFVMVGGRYNDPIVTTPTDTYTNGMPLFIIGNGNGAANRANALTIYGDEFGKTMDVQSDIEIGKLSGRLILKSPDGTRWAITVDNSGIVSAAAI